MIVLLVLGYTLLAVVAIVGGYLLLVPFGTHIPVNRKFKHVKDGIDIYVSTNGVHVDYILPAKNHIMDWAKVINSQPFPRNLGEYPHLGIGWGDPGFYLEIETWGHLTAKIAARAMLYPTPTIMHVTGYDQLPHETLKIEKISISQNQYLELCGYIYKAFALKSDQEVDLIPNVGYTEHDNFYKANGYYHAFHTCNYWVNKGLKKIGVRTSLWSPWDRGIFIQLDKLKKENTPEKTLASAALNTP